MKRCPTCDRLLSEGEYWNNRTSCKSCMRKVSTEWYRANKDLINERRRLRYWETVGPFTRIYGASSK